MLVVANFANTKLCKKPQKCLKPWHMGTHLRVLGKSHLMNTKVTRLGWLSKILHPLVLWTKVVVLGFICHICPISFCNSLFLSLFQLSLMRSIRESIKVDKFPDFVRSFMLLQFPDRQYPEWAVDALSSVNITLT